MWLGCVGVYASLSLYCCHTTIEARHENSLEDDDVFWVYYENCLSFASFLVGWVICKKNYAGFLSASN